MMVDRDEMRKKQINDKQKNKNTKFFLNAPWPSWTLRWWR